MWVDQASYRRYEGSRRPGRGVSLAIASTMIRKMRRQRLVKIFVYVFPLIVCAITVFVLSLVYLSADAFPFLKRFESLNLLAWANRMFQDRVGFVTLIVAALTGGPLIAEDRRARALPLYFSRPITHFDYVLGKLLTIWFFLSMLLLLTPVLLYLVEVSLNPKEGIVTERLDTLWRSLVPSVARMVPLSVVMLAVSSLMRRASHAALLFFGIFMPLHGITLLFARTFDNPAWLALSPELAVRAITDHLLPLPGELLRRRGALGLPPIGVAWTSLALWTAGGLAVLLGRIRRVEVVT